MNITEGSSDLNVKKANELTDFISGFAAIRLSQILAHAEQLLSVIQKWKMAEIDHWLELLESGGEIAVHADIEHSKREGRAPAEMFFDSTAWGIEVEDSECGRKLNIQDLPDSARSFLFTFIQNSEFQIDSDLEGMPDYQLNLFLESFEYLSPEEIVSHINRLLERFFAND